VALAEPARLLRPRGRTPRASLGQIAAAGKFAEYFEPFTGKPLGSLHQSWTAAIALDWSAPEHGSQAS